MREGIKHRTEYRNTATEKRASYERYGKDTDTQVEPDVLEYVEVYDTDDPISTTDEEQAKKIKYHAKSRGHSYIRIISPAVNEALRCVVDYYPGLELSEEIITIKEPFAVFIFYEDELTKYREPLKDAGNQDWPASCENRYAYKHIGIAQQFVRDFIQEDVIAERERHARGFATFDMLWLLYKPGSDIYMDYDIVGEHDPFVVHDLDFDLRNGVANRYELEVWNVNADVDWVGTCVVSKFIERFAGEKEITSLVGYPCEYLRFSNGVTEQDLKEIRDHFIARGKKWYDLRRKIGCHSFDGPSTTFPRRNFVGHVVVDPIQYFQWRVAQNFETTQRAVLRSIVHPSSPLRICSCERCSDLIYSQPRKPRFAGYGQINPLKQEGLTDHQYFLCDKMVESFTFKTRTWEKLHISGFKSAIFDKSLLDHLVMKESTKALIKDLTQMYIRDSTYPSLQEVHPYIRIENVHNHNKTKKTSATWSADFVQGKGEGLTFLLHGKPGIGKTYTAECIANYTGRPLLTLTCADIGVDPQTVEHNLCRWFDRADMWGAIMLIDEADIYMEHRAVQDVKRNHLVAGFLRALEYFRGILFLTTNRVGHFDEAFVSRIHVQIYYPEFGNEQRSLVWNRFFEKLEEDRETTMRIHQAAKDYIESEELMALKWNGRQIRNSFQVAVALAEAQGHKDESGRIVIKRDHIKATVQMSKEFKDYLEKVHMQSLERFATTMGNRYDAYDSVPNN
ncbi:P-loop containing nucleoside triphosphate hydrolase protein [Xylariales sp. PMI_506]|nr:P-loop containing nucleoside triphosphate hydrolase protein [Xylariales sp. PMI_506]